MQYSVLQYGALGDGKTNDAEKIQKVIDLCYEQGGGVVLLDSGHVFVSGSLILKENVELHIERGAVLKASKNLEDYALIDEAAKLTENRKVEVPTFENCDYDGKPRQYFLYARNANHICLSGGGKIDGSEEIYYGERREDQIDGAFYPRIPLILMENCRYLTIRDITITKSGFWTTHLVGCEEVDITGVRILNNLMMANCDGIDPDHCKHVRITNCHIESADDCIVMKTTDAYRHYGACEDILISGCTLVSTSAAIKIGTESVSEFRNILIDHCSIYQSNRGISFQLRDEGSIENVMISNCIIQTRQASSCWWGCGEPINITSVNRRAEIESGTIRHVTISNVICEGEGSIVIYGDKENKIEDISLDHVRHTLKKNTKYPITGYDLRPCACQGILPGKISGIYAEHVQGLEMTHTEICVDESMQAFTEQETEINSGRMAVS